MASTGADKPAANTSDTGRVPALPSASLAPSPTQQPAAAPEARTAPAAERRIAVLGPTLRFKGDLSAEEDFILQGRIHGSIHHSQRIIVGTQGSVIGNIYARVVVIDGSVEGDLYGIESVVVHDTGRVAGNIFAPRVGLGEGAVFNGRIDMTGTSVINHGANPAANQSASKSASQGIPQGIPQSGPQSIPQNVQSISNNPTAPRRVESPIMNPGQPMSAEATEKVLTPKVISVLPPPPRREKTG
jgi:cytoskeletal protein CcmA (bactofilin family)